MDMFKCKYIDHENEEIIGFCLNHDCQNTTQYCYECLNTTHSQHFNDCIRFTKMIKFITELTQMNNKLRKQFKDVQIQLQNYFEQIFKKMDQEITILENITHQLQNKEYLAIKSQIHIIKQYYSKEKEICEQQQLIELNNILDTLKKMLTDQTNVDQKDIKVELINQQTEDQNNKINFEESERLLNEGIALRNLKKFQEAIESFDKAISINPKYDRAWNNKGFALNSLKKYQVAIECFDKAISINARYDTAWYNKGSVLDYLNKYQEAIECYDKVISINPKADNVWNNKGLSLHNLKKYEDAIKCYDQALSICINPNRLKNKADSLFELQSKQEAKQCYLDALRQGSNDKDYINRQLAKL